jgi:hypothetical protein
MLLGWSIKGGVDGQEIEALATYDKYIQTLRWKNWMEEVIWKRKLMWESNITNVHKQLIHKFVNWILLGQNQWQVLLNTVTNPFILENFLAGLATTSFWRINLLHEEDSRDYYLNLFCNFPSKAISQFGCVLPLLNLCVSCCQWQCNSRAKKRQKVKWNFIYEIHLYFFRVFVFTFNLYLD